MKGDYPVVLGAKELEMLKLTSQGFTYIEIARKTGMSASTVKNQMCCVLRKLEAHTRAHAVCIAKDKGLI